MAEDAQGGRRAGTGGDAQEGVQGAEWGGGFERGLRASGMRLQSSGRAERDPATIEWIEIERAK